MTKEAELQNRCARNRKRSKRRSIYCPVHGCCLDSVSQKYPLFADRAEHLRQRGMSRKNAMLLVANQNTVPLVGEWLEAFWCSECQDRKWYHVRKLSDRDYEVALAPAELWQQVSGVINPQGNPSVSEFTRRQSRRLEHEQIKDFSFVG